MASYGGNDASRNAASSIALPTVTGYEELPAVEAAGKGGFEGEAPAAAPGADLDTATELTALDKDPDAVSVAATAQPPGHNGVFASAVLLSKTVVGSGVLSLPFAFKGTGVALGCLLLLIMFSLSSISLMLIATTREYCREKYHTYGGIARVAFGRWGTMLTHVFIVVQCLGATTSYFILMGDLVSPPIGYWMGDTPDDYCSGWAKRQVPIYFGLAVEAALCSLPSLHALRHAAALAMGSMLYLVVVVVVTSGKDIRKSWNDPEFGGEGTVRAFTLTTDVFKSVSIITFAFTCQFNVLPVLGELREPSRGRTWMVCMGTMCLCATMYLFAGSFGYLTFYDDTKGNLLLNFQADNTYVTVGRFCVFLSLLAGYPLTMRACVASLDALVFPGKSQVGAAWLWRRRLVWLVVCVGITFAIACSVSDVSLVLGLLGAVASTPISYVLPGSIFLKMHYRRNHVFQYTRWTLAAWFCLIFGSIFGIVATVMAVVDIVDGDDKDDCTWYQGDAASSDNRCCPVDRSDNGWTPRPLTAVPTLLLRQLGL